MQASLLPQTEQTILPVHADILSYNTETRILLQLVMLLTTVEHTDHFPMK